MGVFLFQTLFYDATNSIFEFFQVSFYKLGLDFNKLMRATAKCFIFTTIFYVS